MQVDSSQKNMNSEYYNRLYYYVLNNGHYLVEQFHFNTGNIYNGLMASSSE